MKYYIYAIINKVNGKMYIGQTNNARRRRNKHFTELRCKRHDNIHLERAFHKYGEENFEFKVLLETDCTRDEISQLEIEYIAKYDTYKNGYNENRGGFEHNGFESKLSKEDIFNICSVLEFGESKSGGCLAGLYNITRTTIYRIKKRMAYEEIIYEYDMKAYSGRNKIYDDFCRENDFLSKKHDSNSLKTIRKFTSDQVNLILSQLEFGCKKKERMAKFFGISDYTITCIQRHKTYKYESDVYYKMDEPRRKVIYNESQKYFGF